MQVSWLWVKGCQQLFPLLYYGGLWSFDMVSRQPTAITKGKIDGLGVWPLTLVCGTQEDSCLSMETGVSPLESVRQVKKTVSHLVKCEKEFVSYTNVDDLKDSAVGGHPRVASNEVILCVDVFNPIKVNSRELCVSCV